MFNDVRNALDNAMQQIEGSHKGAVAHLQMKDESVKAEAEATEEATTEAPNEFELDEYSNSPDEDYFDADTQLNKLSGGLNGPKKQLKKEYPGDNPLAVDLETKLAKMLSDM